MDSNGLCEDVNFTCRVCGNHSYFHHYDTYYCASCGVVFKNVYMFTLPDVKIITIHDDAVIPTRAKEGDIGMDLYSVDDVIITAGTVKMVHTGICIKLPNNTEAQIRSRSGMGKKGIMVANQPGTIDTGYTGEICILLYNSRKESYIVKKGDRIAQMIIAPKIPYKLKEVEALEETERGSAGFNSTGR
jgi:dUTP pyrophosphatase